MKEKLSIITLNINMYNKNSKIKRNTDEVAKFLLAENPSLISLQEFGNRSFNGDINGINLIRILENNNYTIVEPYIDGKNPVNVRLLFDKTKIELVERLPPLYSKFFVNRQIGGLFKTLGGIPLIVFSIHLPLYERNPKEKRQMWENIISFAKVKQNKSIIIAGDFNENSLNNNPTILSDKIEELSNYFKPASEKEIPTWRNKKLDHIFVNPELVVEKYKTLENTVSDHKALTLNFNLEV